jgi:hypothetical protein
VASAIERVDQCVAALGLLSGGVKNTEARQALEYGINIGRGGVFLNLTEEQYSKLKRGK